MRFIVFLIVGAIQWAIDVAIYLLLWPIVGIAAAQAAAKTGGALTGFLLNRKHTFGVSADSGGLLLQGFRFLLLWLANWIISVLLIYWLYHSFAISPAIGKVITDVIIVPSNFLLMKHWVFRAPPECPQEQS